MDIKKKKRLKFTLKINGYVVLESNILMQCFPINGLRLDPIFKNNYTYKQDTHNFIY